MSALRFTCPARCGDGLCAHPIRALTRHGVASMCRCACRLDELEERAQGVEARRRSIIEAEWHSQVAQARVVSAARSQLL